MYMVTINISDARNWTPEMIKQDDAEFRFITGQLEIAPTTGQRHYQIFIQLKTPQRMTRVKAILQADWAHCEPKSRNSTVQQCIDYCRKEESRAPGAEPFTHGECTQTQGQRNDIGDAVAAIKRGAGMAELIDDHPELIVKYARGMSTIIQHVSRERSLQIRADLQVTVLWGVPGAGKTRAVYDRHGLENVFTLHQMPTLWFDGYTNQPVLLLDDFYGWIQWGTLLKMLDIYPFQGPIKGGFTYLQCKHIYLTSNRPWYSWYKRADQEALQRRIHNVVRYDRSEGAGNGYVEVAETVECRDPRYQTDGQFAEGFNPPH